MSYSFFEAKPTVTLLLLRDEHHSRSRTAIVFALIVSGYVVHCAGYVLRIHLDHYLESLGCFLGRLLT